MFSNAPGTEGKPETGKCCARLVGSCALPLHWEFLVLREVDSGEQRQAGVTAPSTAHCPRLLSRLVVPRWVPVPCEEVGRGQVQAGTCESLAGSQPRAPSHAPPPRLSWAPGWPHSRPASLTPMSSPRQPDAAATARLQEPRASGPLSPGPTDPPGAKPAKVGWALSLPSA